jgi:hypothetical protein
VQSSYRTAQIITYQFTTESELLYNCRSVSQPVLASRSCKTYDQILVVVKAVAVFFCHGVCCLLRGRVCYVPGHTPCLYRVTYKYVRFNLFVFYIFNSFLNFVYITSTYTLCLSDQTSYRRLSLMLMCCQRIYQQHVPLNGSINTSKFEPYIYF